MPNEDLPAEVLGWLKTGELWGLKGGMSEFDVIQLLGNPDLSGGPSLEIGSAVSYYYGKFELVFLDTPPETSVQKLAIISIEHRRTISRAFGFSADHLTPTLKQLVKFLDRHAIKHDFETSLALNPTFPDQGGILYTELGLEFSFSTCEHHSARHLYSISQDLTDSFAKPRAYNITIYHSPSESFVERQKVASDFIKHCDVNALSSFDKGEFFRFIARGTKLEAIEQAKFTAERIRLKNPKHHVRWEITPIF